MKTWSTVTILVLAALVGCAGGSRGTGTGTGTKTLYPPLTIEERVFRDKQDLEQDCRIPGKCHRGWGP